MPDTFTPEQIAQILEEFFKVVGTRQYIGARYVPIFGRKDEESIEWDNTAPYEPLTIVLYQGNSYTSRQYVPVGVEITNQEFWAITGNYNAQVELYRRETAEAKDAADDAQADAAAAQTDIDTLLPKADFSAENTVKDYIDAGIEDTSQKIVDLKANIGSDIDNYTDFSMQDYIYGGDYSFVDIRDKVIGSITYESPLSMQAIHVINDVLYYVVNNSQNSTATLYSVPLATLNNPRQLVTVQNMHCTSLGSVNAHMLVMCGYAHIAMYDLNTSTLKEKTYSQPFDGLTLARKTEDDSLEPTVFVGYATLNYGAANYGKVLNNDWWQAHTELKNQFVGYGQDSSASGYVIGHVICSAPNYRTNDRNTPYRHNIIEFFEFYTMRRYNVVKVACNDELEGLYIVSASAANVTCIACDVKGTLYRFSLRLTGSSGLDVPTIGATNEIQLVPHNITDVTIEGTSVSFKTIETFALNQRIRVRDLPRMQQSLAMPTGNALLFFGPSGSSARIVSTNGVVWNYTKRSNENVYDLSGCYLNRQNTSHTYNLSNHAFADNDAFISATGIANNATWSVQDNRPLGYLYPDINLVEIWND